jgi:hypothetical protein
MDESLHLGYNQTTYSSGKASFHENRTWYLRSGNYLQTSSVLVVKKAKMEKSKNNQQSIV